MRKHSRRRRQAARAVIETIKLIVLGFCGGLGAASAFILYLALFNP